MATPDEEGHLIAWSKSLDDRLGSLRVASPACDSEGLSSGLAEQSMTETGNELEVESTPSARFDWAHAGSIANDDTLTCSSSTVRSPSPSFDAHSDCLMTFANFHCRIAESVAVSSLISCPATPLRNTTTEKQIADTLKTVHRLLDTCGYRCVGLSAPVVEDKRLEMERYRNLANRADDAAQHARSLLNLQCLQSALPLEIRERISTFFPAPPSPPSPPPPPPDDDFDDSSDEDLVFVPKSVYCIDFVLR
eukprot:TRINITY_DN13825_c0_g2_i1.p1 TRINITY_DN13825_c0_g2~~TRINITY_DN13825_c0_g2_i1.p1  ORF type:complete len:250 (+),score=27.84 TRINITY_DN13825_c0_g2_i1:60-809(+)